MDKKDSRLEIRLNFFDKEIIKANAKQSNLSISEYLVRCGTNRKLPKPLSKEELEKYDELKKMQVNFVRISNFIKKYNDENIKSEVKILIAEMQKELNNIRNGK